jgi:hypothetical protein
VRFWKSLRSIKPIASAASVEAPPSKATRVKSTDPTGQAVAGAYGTPERGNPEPLGATIDPATVSQRRINKNCRHFITFLSGKLLLLLNYF